MSATRLTSTATRTGALPVTCPTKSTEKGHRSLSSLVDDQPRFTLHATSRPVTGMCRPPPEAVGLTASRRRLEAHWPHRASAPADDEQGCRGAPCPKRALRGANAPWGCPATGEAGGLTAEELATRTLPRRPTTATRSQGHRPYPGPDPARAHNSRAGKPLWRSRARLRDRCPVMIFGYVRRGACDVLGATRDTGCDVSSRDAVPRRDGPRPPRHLWPRPYGQT